MGANVVRFDAHKPATAWADKISSRWSGGLDAVFDTGQLLIDAKAALQHGEFEAMIAASLPFTAATARKLMVMASKAVLANRSNRNVLPTAWSTVYELALAKEADLQQWFDQGRITPSLKLMDAVLMRGGRPRKPRPVSERRYTPPPMLPAPPSMSSPAVTPNTPLEQVWADKIIDTLASLVRQFDGVDLAAIQRSLRHQQSRDLATLIRAARNWLDILELSKEQRR